MALARLLHAEKRLFSQRKENPLRNLKSRRSSSSSSAATSEKTSFRSKKAESGKEQRAIAVEAFVRKYMEMNPGVFPTVTHVRAEVGGSWYIVKDILKGMKERLMDDTQIQRMPDPWVRIQATPVTQDMNAEATSETTKMAENPNTATCKDIAQLSETVTDIQIDQKILDLQVRMQATSVSRDINEGATSEAIKMDGNPDTAASKDVAQLSETVTDSQIDQRTLDSQVRMQATSIKQDINAEATSEATKREENPDAAASKNTAQLSATMTDIQIDQRSTLSRELPVMSERSLNAAPDISRVVESQDGDLSAAKHSVKAMGHVNGQGAEKLARMISRLYSDVGDREFLNVEKSNKGKVVINGNKLPERRLRSLSFKEIPKSVKLLHQRSHVKGEGPSLKQRSAPSTVPALNEQPFKKLAYLFQHNQIRERSDKKICMENGAESNDRVSNTFSDDVNAEEKSANGLLDLIKDFCKTPPKDTHHNKFNPQNKDPRHNSLGIMPGRLKHLEQSEEQKKLDGSNICNEINRPKQIDEKVGAKEINCIELSLNGEKSSCSSINRLDKVEVETKISFYNHDVQFEIKDESGNESDCAAVDYPMLASNAQIQPTQATTNGIFLHTEKGRIQNHLMVRFLPKSATEKDIRAAFASCGPIAKIFTVPSRDENWFNYAYVYFKTEEGLRKAVSRSNIYVAGSDVLVESTSPMLNVPKKVCAPDVVDDPNFPISLLKNPKRTIMVQGLHQDVASRHLIHALSFCGHISGFSMGSSTDVAYVEFETEEAKEKALSASSISIFGTRLSLYRIDMPQTTVVRINNIGETQYQKIFHICRSFGQIKKVQFRGIDTVDVHFRTTEWARMVKILNSLNGMVVDGHQWVAQPGTLIPFDILQVLWKEPDGRQYVYSLAQDLSMKIGGGLTNTAEVTRALKDYYGLKA